MNTITIPKKEHKRSKTGEIQQIVRKEVIDVIREVLSDPDAGFVLTSKFTRRLKQSLKDKEARRVTPLSKIFEQYGL